ncbi:uncharacterized protein LOC129302335 [Prosopis cineraria]|uniref:uncharacterized protein LOC129302335 n=3 Tax=Prosopis cineraria TaxID=364024 RepID=UPI00240ED186|nr:uncharacterized protein LOC129302335 [Prosopis cineraria]
MPVTRGNSGFQHEHLPPPLPNEEPDLAELRMLVKTLTDKVQGYEQELTELKRQKVTENGDRAHVESHVGEGSSSHPATPRDHESRRKEIRQEEQRAPPTITDVWKTVRKFNPPTFDGNLKPSVVEEWVKRLESIFRVVTCTSNQKVQVALVLLVKGARDWWETAGPRDDSTLTWEEFKEKLFRHYFPSELRSEKEAEFHAFKQGNLDEDTFIAKFQELSRYSTYLQYRDDSEWKAKRLLEKARPELREQLAHLDIRDYDEMCIKLQVVARSKKEVEREKRGYSYSRPPTYPRPTGGIMKKNHQGSSSSWNQGRQKGPFQRGQGQRSYHSSYHGSQRSPTVSTPAPSTASSQQCTKCGRRHFGQCWVCYICGKPGHIAKFCGDNQGSNMKNPSQHPTVSGRVFALTQDTMNSPDAIRGASPAEKAPEV